MRQDQPVDLLHHPRRSLAPDRQGAAAQVRLDLIEGELFFPSLVIDQRGLLGRHLGRLEQVGDQSMSLASSRASGIVVRVFDYPHHPPSPVVATVAGVGVDLGQVGTVVEPAQRLEDRVALDPGQEVAAPLAGRADQLVAEEAAIPDQQHARPEIVEQRADHRRLAVAQRLDRQPADGMGAELAEGQQADLREGPVGASARRSAEGAGVLRRVGQVEHGAVEAHQSPAAIEGPDGLVGRHGVGRLEEELAEGRDAQASAGLSEGGVGGLGLITSRVKATPDLGDRIGGEEGHGDDEPDDGLGR